MIKRQIYEYERCLSIYSKSKLNNSYVVFYSTIVGEGIIWKIMYVYVS